MQEILKLMDEAHIKRLAFTVVELAKSLGISRTTTYALVNRADFPAIRLGKKVVVPIQPLEAWLEKECRRGTCDE